MTHDRLPSNSASASVQLRAGVPLDWRAALGSALTSPSFQELAAFVAEERRNATIYPNPEDVFAALRLTPFEGVRAVVLGQDPYHGPGQAHGLAFSVSVGVKIPPSLRNIHAELVSELKVAQPQSGSLEPWATRGILLLNTVLTVRGGSPRSHRGRGWEAVTDAIIQAVAARPGPIVFLLWGAQARAKATLMEPSRHIVLEAAHPSPFSVRGFRDRAGFAEANRLLQGRNKEEIDWSLP